MAIHTLFYIFAALSLISAFNVIIARNPVKAVLSLVTTFVFTAAIWMLTQAEFLSLVLVVVYVGAVMVLFLFVVMMIDVDKAEIKSGFVRYWPLALVVGVIMTAIVIWAVGPKYYGLGVMPMPAASNTTDSNIADLGMALFTDYLYPFILAAAILLAAMVAAITLTFRGRRNDSKGQIPGKQIEVKAKDRLSIIKMPSESPNTQAGAQEEG